MASRKFKIKLSQNDIKKLEFDLNTYARYELTEKVNLFLERLAEKGIKVAYNHVYDEFSPYIDFEFSMTGAQQGAIVGTPTAIHRVYVNKKGEHDVEINPLLMAEFGAGRFANTDGHENIPSSAGRGKFEPNEGHAFQDVWYWKDTTGVVHSSEDDDTIKPTRPMYNAVIEIINTYKEVVKEVFG